MEENQSQTILVRKAQKQISACSERLLDIEKRTESLCASLSEPGREAASELLANVLFQDVCAIEADLEDAGKICGDWLASSPSPSPLRDSVHLSLTVKSQLSAICQNRKQWLSEQRNALRLRTQTRGDAEALSDLAQIESIRNGLENYSAGFRHSESGRNNSR